MRNFLTRMRTSVLLIVLVAFASLAGSAQLVDYSKTKFKPDGTVQTLRAEQGTFAMVDLTYKVEYQAAPDGRYIELVADAKSYLPAYSATLYEQSYKTDLTRLRYMREVQRLHQNTALNTYKSRSNHARFRDLPRRE